MKTTCAILVFIISAILQARADWSVLKNDKGDIVEIAVDFTIKEKTVNPDGSVSMILSATHAGEEAGFSAQVSKPREGDIAVAGKKKRMSVMRSDVIVTSSGAPTKTLEKLLLHQLDAQDAGDGGPLHVVGLYSAISASQMVSFFTPSLFHASDVGLTFDDTGKHVLGSCFRITFFMDIPMKRFTAYFSTPAGIGGTSEATRTRIKKELN